MMKAKKWLSFGLLLIATSTLALIQGDQVDTTALYDKGSQVFNVKSYGAIGDAGVLGTTDAAKIQLALDAAGPGGTVFIPVGYYKLEAAALPLKVYQGQTIRGAGLCDITLGLGCGTILQPTASTGSQTVFRSKFPLSTDCTRSPAFTPKCADYVTFQNLLVIANGNNDIDFDLTNMSEALLDRVGVIGRLSSGPTGQIGVKVSPANNNGSPTGGLETRIQNSRIFNIATGIKVQHGNATMIGPNNHIHSNTVGVQIDGRCTGGTCTTGLIVPCLANADCSSGACGGTAGVCNNNPGLVSVDNDIFDSVIENNPTNILNVGSFTKVHANHMENGSGACISIDERGSNSTYYANGIANNISCTASIQLTGTAAAPIATRVIIRDNTFDGSGKYVNEANTSTAILVERNNYNGAGTKVTMNGSPSGIRWIDTVEQITFAGLGLNGLGSGVAANCTAGAGSMLYCSNCVQPTSVPGACTSGAGQAIARCINSLWNCN